MLRAPARLDGLHLDHLLAAVQGLQHAGDDVLGLERLAVVLADVAVGRQPRLGPQQPADLLKEEQIRDLGDAQPLYSKTVTEILAAQ